MTSIDIKTLGKILTNKIPPHIKIIIHHNQVSFFIGIENDTKSVN